MHLGLEHEVDGGGHGGEGEGEGEGGGGGGDGGYLVAAHAPIFLQDPAPGSTESLSETARHV